MMLETCKPTKLVGTVLVTMLLVMAGSAHASNNNGFTAARINKTKIIIPPAPGLTSIMGNSSLLQDFDPGDPSLELLAGFLESDDIRRHKAGKTPLYLASAEVLTPVAFKSENMTQNKFKNVVNGTKSIIAKWPMAFTGKGRKPEDVNPAVTASSPGLIGTVLENKNAYSFMQYVRKPEGGYEFSTASYLLIKNKLVVLNIQAAHMSDEDMNDLVKKTRAWISAALKANK